MTDDKNKDFIKWIVCDQRKNKCPTVEELRDIVDEYYEGLAEYFEFEISLVKENNELGQISYGWSGDEKIILFSHKNYEFETVDELYKNLVSFYERAEKKCMEMNDKEEDFLY